MNRFRREPPVDPVQWAEAAEERPAEPGKRGLRAAKAAVVKEKLHGFHVRMTAAELDGLARVAADEGTTGANVVRKALREYVKRHQSGASKGPK